MTISGAVKLLREEKHWSQARLALELRVSPQAVAGWEQARRKPYKALLEKLAALTANFDLADFFAEQAGLPPRKAHRDVFPGVPSTDAQSRMELHAGLDVILDRAPTTVQEKFAEIITRSAGEYGNMPVSNPAGRSPSGEEKRLTRLLQKILDSANSEAIEAVTKNLEVFARYAEAKAAANAASVSRDRERPAVSDSSRSGGAAAVRKRRAG